MKILEIDLRAFGPFANAKLDLAEGREGLHIVYGPNEAGKSSALRALKCLLYGIPKHSADNFLHDNKALRIGGRLRNSNGAELAFMRRKGSRDTLLNGEGQPINERQLDLYLHGVTEEVFGFFFGIDHDTLVRGGRTILAGKGGAAQSLFAAGAGGANLRRVLEAIETEADALFKNRGHLPPINKAISRYHELRKKILEFSQSSREWSEKQKELTKAVDERERLKKTFERQTAEVNRLRRLKEIVPKAGLRRELLAKAQAMGTVTVLPEDFTERRHRSEKRLNAAVELRRQAELDLERLKADIAKIVLPQRLLDQADAVEGIHKRLGQHVKAAEDLGKLQGRLQQDRADIRALLLELKPGLDVQTARGLRPKTATKTRIQRLASQHASVQSEQRRAVRDVRDAEQKRKRLKDELSALETPQDPGPLKRSLGKLAKSGDLPVRLQEARQTLHNEEALVRGALQRLPLWRRTFEDLGQVPVPSSETVSRFEDEFSVCRVLRDNLDRRVGEVREALRAVQQQIDAIRLAGAVSTEQDLEAIRKRRQKGWGLVRRAWLLGEAIEGESRAYDPDHDLAAAYEISVAQADETGDRLRREAARVAEYAALLVQEKKSKEEIGKLESESVQADQTLARTDGQWQAVWKSAGIDPLTPREMRSWLEQYAKILQRLERYGEQKGVIEKLQGQIAAHREELLRRLEELGEKTSSPDEAFGHLIERCETVLDNMETIVRHRAELEAKISSLGEALKENLQAKEEAEQRLRTWETEWSEALEILELEEGTSPDEALVVLAKLEELFKKIDECDSLEQRIFGINRDAEAFMADVKGLINHVAPEWSELMPAQGAVQLHVELTRARNAAAQHAQLAKEIERKTRGLSGAENEMALAMGALNHLCRQAGCATPDELESRAKRSADYQELKRRILSLEADIVERGGGETLQQILREVETADIDALPAQILDLESQLREWRERQAELDEKVGRLRHHLEHIDGSSSAAEAAEESQGVLAYLRDRVEEYATLRLASLVLRQTIENYRAKNQGPLLKRASELFARLTMDSFAGLQTDYSASDEPILQGVRPDGRVVDVNGMSDGTLDQLYLSLRLATLEKYLAANEAMPFIVDDILIRFDDHRARATLQVLAELSNKTQILFFTHNQHLPALAQKQIDPAFLVIHELGV